MVLAVAVAISTGALSVMLHWYYQPYFAAGNQRLPAVLPEGPAGPVGAFGRPKTEALAQCLAPHGFTQWTSYQPASQYWSFQWIESGWLLALSALLIAATVWLVRRRAA